VVLTSGKLFYDLDAHRRQASVGDVAILRLEELYPFPAERVAALLERYERIEDVVWAQEEPRNMGAWNYLSEELRRVLAPGQSLRAVTRRESPSPATGSNRRHVAQQAALVAEALVGAPEGRAASPPRKVGAAG
jgi:2-oxoglutarate dehydrogenase E1 component